MPHNLNNKIPLNQKQTSSVVRAWEALGLVKPINNKFQLSPRGIDLVNTNFESEKWFKIIQRSILSYGPIIGYLQDALEEGESFEFSKLFISYPLTEEPMELSTYSTKDSNTRTVSMLTSWCIQGGLITPLAVEGEGNQLPHLAYRNIINEKRLTTRKFTITSYAKNYIENVPYVDNPLSYKNLNKNVGSLREKNSANIRNRTQEFNSIILNRRFAILYVLNNINNSILFSNLIALFKRHCNVFFLPNSNIESVLQSELGICKLSGLILKYNMIDNDLCIKRCSNINNEIISFEAPEGIIQLAVDMVNMVG